MYKGRHFYGPGCEYHVFAGRDATRLLAKNSLEEENPEAASVPLSLGERASLAGWMVVLRSKYEVVGRFEGAELLDGGGASIDASAPSFLAESLSSSGGPKTSYDGSIIGRK